MRFELETSEAQYILAVLSEKPFQQVAGLINKIAVQMNNQDQDEVPNNEAP